MTPAGGPMRVADETANGRHDDAPTQQLSIATVSDRCVNCAAPLASDQRYCINCGERRGKPRFALAGPAESTPEMVTVTTTSRPARGPRTTAGFNLIAGIATLLLAMGVGVLIGHNSANAPQRSPANTVITVGGGTGAATTANGAAATASSGRGGKKSKSSTSNSAKPTKGAPATVVVQKAAAAAAKVTGGGAAVAAPTATQGSSCSSSQAGCQNGKFTGNNFFGQ